MRSGNWFFSMPLLKKNACRFWPLWGLYTLILILILPVFFLTNRPTWYVEPLSTVFHNYIMQLAVNPFLAFFFAIAVAMALWSYLYNTKPVSLIHALPLRRETIFLTNYVTGLLFFLAPMLVVLLLSLGVQAVVGAVALKALLAWLFCQGLMAVFFFSFATLLAFVTGHIVTLPALYFIFTGLFYGLRQLLDFTFSQFVYGYANSPALDWIGERFTPLVMMLREVRLESDGYQHVFYYLTGQMWLYLYAGIGLLLAGFALLLYRSRKLETAGEVISVSWLRPVFKYGVALCGALTFGNLFYSMFAYSGGLPEGVASMLLFLLMWGAISYFAAEMLLKKSFRVFKQGWKGCVILLAVILAAMLAMDWDVLGMERRVPEPEQVESVWLRGQYWSNSSEDIGTNQDFIAAVTEFHRLAAHSKQDVAYWQRQQNDNWQIQEGDFHWNWISIQYQMKNGSFFERQYTIPVSKSLLEQEGSLAKAYEGLLNHQAWRVETNLPARYEREQIYQVRFSRNVGIPYEASPVEAAQWTNNEIYLSQETAQRLYDAVREDLQAGRLCTRYLAWEDEREINLANELAFYFRTGNGVGNVYIELQTTASSTLAVLEDLGFERGVDLFTWAEADEMETRYYDDGAYYSEEYNYDPSVTYAEETSFVPLRPNAFAE